MGPKKLSSLKRSAFAAMLRNRRIELGLTQQQVADHMGIAQASYSGYETGTLPKIKRLKDLAETLCLDPPEVMAAASQSQDQSEGKTDGRE